MQLSDGKFYLTDVADTEQQLRLISVIEVLTNSPDSKDYWYKMEKRDKLSGIELSTICRQLKLESSDGIEVYEEIVQLKMKWYFSVVDVVEVLTEF